MKCFFCEIEYVGQLSDRLQEAREFCSANEYSDILVHAFYNGSNLSLIPSFLEAIELELPGSKIMGTTSSTSINGSCTSKAAVTLYVNVFSDTTVSITEYDCSEMNEYYAGDQLRQHIFSAGPVSAVELMVTTMHGFGMNAFLDQLNECSESIPIFGCGADSSSLDAQVFVFSNSKLLEHGVVSALYIGSSLHVSIDYALGWKPLGKNLRITKASGTELQEFDGEPAFKIYEKYLQIKNDDDFEDNILEFPLIYSFDGHDVARIPISCDDSGTLSFVSDIDTDRPMRLAYGDPDAIINDIIDRQESLLDFAPQSILLYSCVTRLSFWQNDIGRELEPFASIAPTSGFYTQSEIIRIHGKMLEQNVTMVIAGMREGEKKSSQMKRTIVHPELTGSISLVQRLVKFIQATTQELEDANRKLNEMAITDGLTGLFNRREIERVITELILEIQDRDLSASLIMLDVDDFKHVNDTYGHDVGDITLNKVSELITSNIRQNDKAGRWGGEEFTILIRADIQKAITIAERIRRDIAGYDFNIPEHITISAGVTSLKNNEDKQELYMRIDQAMYDAKRSGKNRVMIV